MARLKISTSQQTVNSRKRLASKNLKNASSNQEVGLEKKRKHRRGFNKVQEMKHMNKSDKEAIPFATALRAIKHSLMTAKDSRYDGMKISRDAVTVFSRGVQHMLSQILEMVGRRVAGEKKIKVQRMLFALTAWEWQRFMPTAFFGPDESLKAIDEFQLYYIQKQKKIES